MVSAMFALYIKRTKEKAVCVKSLPPTDAKLSYHILRAHYKVMLWKAADQQTAGAGCVPNPRIARRPAAAGKACNSHARNYHSAGLSCTPYCFSVDEAMYFILVTKHDENELYMIMRNKVIVLNRMFK